MANTKRKSFVLYTDHLAILKELSDEQAGRLFKMIAAYQSGEEVDKSDFGLNMAFAHFRIDFERDAAKYQEIIRKRSMAGRQHSGNQYSNKKDEQTGQMEHVFQNGTNGTDNVNDNDNVNVNDSKTTNNNKGGSPLSFTDWKGCKEYLVSKGRIQCTDAGFRRFFTINQVGTVNNKPYGYVDGVLESFDSFMAKDENRKKYFPKEQKGKEQSKNPSHSGGSPEEDHAKFNVKISNILKKVQTSSERNAINALKFIKISEQGYEIQTTKVNWNFILNSDLKTIISSEFRGVNINPIFIH